MDIKLTESTFVRVHEDGVCVDIVHRVLEKGEHILVCMSPEEYQTFLDKTCGAQLAARDELLERVVQESRPPSRVKHGISSYLSNDTIDEICEVVGIELDYKVDLMAEYRAALNKGKEG